MENNRKFFINSLLLIVIIFTCSLNIFSQPLNSTNNFEINGSFYYYSGYFPENIPNTTSSFNNTIYMIYDFSFFYIINQQKIGLYFINNSIDWKNPYSLGLAYSIFTKYYDLKLSYNLKTKDFLKYFSFLKFYINIDYYPLFFSKISFQIPFYPEKFFLSQTNIPSSQLSENINFNIDIGFYIYQNEIFFKFNYFNIKDFSSSTSYNLKTQQVYGAGIRLIPTYTLLGYLFELSYTSNSYNSIKYSFLTAKVGIVVKPIDKLYIRGEIGYNYWYFYTGSLITNENPILFLISLNYSF